MQVLDATADPVALVLVNRELSVRTVAGKFSRKLDVRADAALFDGARDLVWVRDGDRVSVVDLRLTLPYAIPIIVGLPSAAKFSIDIRGENVASPDLCTRDLDVTLVWKDEPALATIGWEASEVEPKIVGQKWLRHELRRPALAKAERITFGSTQTLVPLAAGLPRCAQEGQKCGLAVAFGKTGWQLVYAGYDEPEDCAHPRCVLYNPKTRKFSKPYPPFSWGVLSEEVVGGCGNFRFEPSGRFFLHAGEACSVERCVDLGGTDLGWLGANLDVGFEG
ncbi:MAG: hypothetical protein SFV15_03820 [Polyangiaceae bacterium]|nr:hypothetical protein [Polyangiaceae bacterium]